MSKHSVLVFMIGALAVSAAYASQPTKDIVDVARDSGKFRILLRLTDEAGITSNLRAPGGDGKGFTLFAPTDAAFKKVPDWIITDLESNKDDLVKLLRYHVLTGTRTVADFTTSTVVPLSGDDLKIQVTDSTLYADGAKVVWPDMMATNGVVQAIDTVLMPDSVRTNLEKRNTLTIGANTFATTRTSTQTSALQKVQPVDKGLISPIRNRYSTFTDLIEASGMVDTLSTVGPYTLLAPTNEAFDNLPPGALDAIRADKDLLHDFVSYHVVLGDIRGGLLRTGYVSTSEGQQIWLKVGSHGEMKFNTAIVLDDPIMGTNGIVYVMNKPVFPKSVVSALSAKGIRVGD